MLTHEQVVTQAVKGINKLSKVLEFVKSGIRNN